MTPQENLKTMGTWPVFLTAISTILGAILFLRFGYAVAHVGLVSTLMIVFVGHLVTVPTALAVAEIATNQKVEGGGAYYMISRSFGLNIGGAIGLALYLSQAISVAFYVIAFTVACRDLLHWADVAHGVAIDPMWVNLGVMALLTVLMVGKGANLGVKALYIVVVLLFSALVLFFLGSGPGNPNLSPLATIPDVLTTCVRRHREPVLVLRSLHLHISRLHWHRCRAWAEWGFERPTFQHSQRHHLGHRGGHCDLHRRGHQVVVERPARGPGGGRAVHGKHRLVGPHHSHWIGRRGDELGLGQCDGGAADAAGDRRGRDLSCPHVGLAEEGQGFPKRAGACVLGHVRHCVCVCLDGRHQRRGRDHLHVLHGDVRGHLPRVVLGTHGGRSELPSHLQIALVHQP